MKKLQFDTGVEEYQLNDNCVVHFNPADPVFVERIYTVMEKLQKMQDSQKEITEENLFEELHARDKVMRESINSLFPDDGDVCAMLFNNVGLYAFSGGMPLWANLLFAILDEMEDNLTDEQKKSSPRMEYYKKKYGKYLK